MSARSFVPAVPRGLRLGVAGAVWSAVGVMLATWSASWLAAASAPAALALGAGGIGIGVLAWRALFGRLALANIARLSAMPARACLFGFIAPKGWAITAAMVTFGSLLRHSTLPRTWLAVPYAAIGAALFLASLSYYAHLVRVSKGVTS